MNMQEAFLEATKSPRLGEYPFGAKMVSSNMGNHWTKNDDIWVYNGAWFERYSKHTHQNNAPGFQDKYFRTNDQFILGKHNLLADWEIVSVPVDSTPEWEEYWDKQKYLNLKKRFVEA